MRVLQADKDKNELVRLLLGFLDDNIHAINIEKIINPCQKVRTFVIHMKLVARDVCII